MRPKNGIFLNFAIPIPKNPYSGSNPKQAQSLNKSFFSNFQEYITSVKLRSSSLIYLIFLNNFYILQLKFYIPSTKKFWRYCFEVKIFDKNSFFPEEEFFICLFLKDCFWLETHIEIGVGWFFPEWTQVCFISFLIRFLSLLKPIAFLVPSSAFLY